MDKFASVAGSALQQVAGGLHAASSALEKRAETNGQKPSGVAGTALTSMVGGLQAAAGAAAAAASKTSSLGRQPGPQPHPGQAIPFNHQQSYPPPTWSQHPHEHQLPPPHPQWQQQQQQPPQYPSVYPSMGPPLPFTSPAPSYGPPYPGEAAPPPPPSAYTPPEPAIPPGIVAGQMGSPAPATFTAGPVGPFLRFNRYDPATHSYLATVLFLVHHSEEGAAAGGAAAGGWGARGAQAPAGSSQPAPLLSYGAVDAAGNAVTAAGSSPPQAMEYLDSQRGWAFYRGSLSLQCQEAAVLVQYTVHYSAQPDTGLLTVSAKFTLPPHGEGPGSPGWRWGFHSCNGFHDLEALKAAGGIQPLWRDLMALHEKTPMHVLVGGGDQLYNDCVWECPALKTWCAVADKEQRLGHPYAPDMQEQVTDCYLEHYLQHWSEPVFKEALASIPQIMTWDDHDIFDGWGSYDPELQTCPVFQGVFSSARRFYALFQLHSTPERVVKDNQSFGVAGWNNLLYLGPRCALLLLDNRMERQQLQVIDPGTWSMVDAHLRRLPSSVQHLVVVATVPVVYPKLPVVESAAKYLSDVSQSAALTAMMQKTGLAAGLLNQFGAVEILDDLMDHWNADVHVQEKDDLLVRLQNLAQARQLRVSFLSGDVHVAGYGYTRSVANIEPANDFRFMPQIVSSAIGNSPPPAPVVTALTNIGGELKINTFTRQLMPGGVFGPGMLLAARNWAVLQQRPLVQGSLVEDGALVVQLRAEREDMESRGPDVFMTTVPVLECLDVKQ
ncbi:hypothetical protein V8C86DRAFT_1099175 [Haematococcus lacustris]